MKHRDQQTPPTRGNIFMQAPPTRGNIFMQAPPTRGNIFMQAPPTRGNIFMHTGLQQKHSLFQPCHHHHHNLDAFHWCNVNKEKPRLSFKSTIHTYQSTHNSNVCTPTPHHTHTHTPHHITHITHTTHHTPHTTPHHITPYYKQCNAQGTNRPTHKITRYHTHIKMDSHHSQLEGCSGHHDLCSLCDHLSCHDHHAPFDHAHNPL